METVPVNRSAVLIQRELNRLKSLVPWQIAHEQVAWQLDQRVARLHRDGLSRVQVAEALGVIISVIDRRLQRAHERRGRRSPLERYLADKTDILEMAAASVSLQSLPPVLRPWARAGHAPRAEAVSPEGE